MTISARPPFFSVLINTYNYGCYIEEAIDSVLSQTFPQEQIEIIVVDDGSTDDTANRVKKYGDRISYIYKTNGGQASAFNAGVEAANGEIIAFLDSDDYWAPSKLQEVAVEFGRSSLVDFVYHYMDVVDSDRRLLDRYVYPEPVKENYLKTYLSGNLPWFSSTSGMAIKKGCLKKMMPLPEDFSIAADMYLHYLLPFYMQGLSLVKKFLGYYRLHGGNLSGGSLLTAAKLQREQKIILFNIEHVRRHAGNAGLDSQLLIKRMESMVKVYGIYILSVQGHKLSALKEVLHFKDFLPADTMLQRLGRIMTLLIATVMSPANNLRLQRTYRKIWSVVSHTTCIP